MARLKVVAEERDGPDGEANLRVDGVTQVFETAGGPLMAVTDVSFTVEEGTFVGLVGPSGCGKSSLLQMMAGLLNPTEGRIVMGEEEILEPKPVEIGVIFQESSLLPWKSARENVEFPLYLRGVERSVREKAALEMLDLVGLGEFAERRPHELSGGMKQRVAIARGFCQDPSVLLMDEPFAALDALTREKMALELQNLWLKASKSVLFITHSIPEAVFLADRVILLTSRPGRVDEEVAIDIPRPRSIDTMAAPSFAETCNHLRRRLDAIAT